VQYIKLNISRKRSRSLSSIDYIKRNYFEIYSVQIILLDRLFYLTFT